MTPTQQRHARNATVFFVFEDCDFDDLPYHRGSISAARALARRLNNLGRAAAITDQDENVIETYWM